MTFTFKFKLAFKLAKYVFKLLNGPIWNFAFTLKLFNDHLNVSDVFKNGDLDLDLQDQIYLETLKICVIPCECNNFLTIRNFSFKLELCFDHLNVPYNFKNG